MISVIVCSIRPDYLNQLKINIEKTIGIEHELLAIDNRNTNKGLTTVFNEAARQATFDILCFVHEDVLFHSDQWGNKLVGLFADPSNGLIGISGSIYKSAYPSAWTACSQDFYRVNTWQHFNGKEKPVHCYHNPFEEDYSKVAVIDGVFMATKKNIWSEHPFDEHFLQEFHGYDLDFSLEIGKYYNVIVSYDILIEHFSEGSFNKAWLISMMSIHNKWKKRLPVSIGHMDKNLKKKSDYMAATSSLLYMVRNKWKKKDVLQGYLILIVKFFMLNKLKYSKTVFQYIFS